MWYNVSMEKDRETIPRYLLEGWEEAAKSEGALQRSRKIKTAEDLLYLVLLYLTGAGSFQNASKLMRLSTDIQLNKEAVRKRIMGCWKWLWREYQIILLLLTSLLLNVRRTVPIKEFLPRLPGLCRASKRKRSLTLSRLLKA